MTKDAMVIASAMAASETRPSHSRVISCQVSPSSSCSRTSHTMMRVPLNVGWPPQILGSATICRPSSIRCCCPFAFAFMPLHQSMRPRDLGCKPANAPAIRTRASLIGARTFLSAFAPTPRSKRTRMSALQPCKLAAEIMVAQHISVRSSPPFAMEQVKAVRVNKPETGGKRRRH